MLSKLNMTKIYSMLGIDKSTYIFYMYVWCEKLEETIENYGQDMWLLTLEASPPWESDR